MLQSKYVGCKFLRLFYLYPFILVIHDGRRVVVLDPLDLHNISAAGAYVAFSVPRIMARRYGWLTN